MSDHAELRDELVRWIPNLRAFALSLTQSAQHSDDLVQDTLVKALSNPDKFRMGTNLRGLAVYDPAQQLLQRYTV